MKQCIKSAIKETLAIALVLFAASIMIGMVFAYLELTIGNLYTVLIGIILVIAMLIIMFYNNLKDNCRWLS